MWLFSVLLSMLIVLSDGMIIPFQGIPVFLITYSPCYYDIPITCYGVPFYIVPVTEQCPVVELKCRLTDLSGLTMTFPLTHGECLDFSLQPPCVVSSITPMGTQCQIGYTCIETGKCDHTPKGQIQVLPIYFIEGVPVYPAPEPSCRYISLDEGYVWMQCNHRVSLKGICSRVKTAQRYQCMPDHNLYGTISGTRRDTPCKHLKKSCHVMYDL